MHKEEFHDGKVRSMENRRSYPEWKLSKVKHTILEGCATENGFAKQFFERTPKKFTSGWWSAIINDQRFFFLVSKTLNDVDRRVIEILSPNYPCWRVYYDNEMWNFSAGNSDLSQHQFLEKYKIGKKEKLSFTKKKAINKCRQEKCIEYFKKQHKLWELASERDFADYFLETYAEYPVNIDFFALKDNNQLCAIEVKFKYMMRDGSFGMNVGQYNLLNLLKQSEIEIYYAVLWNATGNNGLSIFEFLKQKDAVKVWLCKQISNFTEKEKRTAPSKTQVHGQTPQSFYSFAREEFQLCSLS